MAEKGGRQMKVLVAVVVILFVVVGVVSMGLAHFVANGKRPTLEEAWEWQSARYDTSFYEDLERQDYLVAGCDGYELHVQLLKNPEETDRYVILTHGNMDNHIGSLKYVQLFMGLGFNCIVYDMRGHGEDEPQPCTYGLLESADLLELIADTKARYPDMGLLGLHGESLGGAVTIEALASAPDVAFVVSDCAFTDLERALKFQLEGMHLPGFLASLADIGTRVLYGYSIYEIRPIDALDANAVPILFIQGDADTSVPSACAQDLYERASGVRELYYVEGAGHAESVIKAPEEYRRVVRDFLARI